VKYLTETDLAGERGAHISDCGFYRYRLWREWDRSLPTLAFLMLNPSGPARAGWSGRLRRARCDRPSRHGDLRMGCASGRCGARC